MMRHMFVTTYFYIAHQYITPPHVANDLHITHLYITHLYIALAAMRVCDSLAGCFCRPIHGSCTCVSAVVRRSSFRSWPAPLEALSTWAEEVWTQSVGCLYGPNVDAAQMCPCGKLPGR